MSEANNEDAPVSSLHKQQPSEDDDLNDDIQDFRLFAALTGNSGKIPKRGEKDFEPHGTKHQDAILEASRQAMHDVLSQTISHAPRNHVKAYYYGEGVGDTEEFADVFKEENRGKGFGEDHIVMVENSQGLMYKTMGKQGRGKIEGGTPRLWLLPEEALYLVERGSLDLRWPTRSSSDESASFSDEDLGEELESEFEGGIPMSVQAAFAMLIGSGTQKWKIDMDRYAVYTNLKRAGYAVLRAPDWDPYSYSRDQRTEPPSNPGQSIFTQLWGRVFAEKEIQYQPHGPLVQPGLYRSYNSIYRQLSVIPLHKPLPVPTSPSPPPSEPFRVIYHLWKPANLPNYKKTEPGLPDIRLAVVSARETSVPTLTQISGLLESTPFNPPPKDLVGHSKSYSRIKHGYRNVVLAVVDQGIISYLKMSEGAFGEEKLFERKAGSLRGGKGGGRGGNRRGRGRGRGRGR